MEKQKKILIVFYKFIYTTYKTIEMFYLYLKMFDNYRAL